MSEKFPDQDDQVALSGKALRLKQEGAEQPRHPEAQDRADTGMKPTPQHEQAPSGNFDAEGQRPVLERSRKVR